MPERPRPEIEPTRKALREHDERVDDQSEPDEPEEDAGGEDEDED